MDAVGHQERVRLTEEVDEHVYREVERDARSRAYSERGWIGHPPGEATLRPRDLASDRLRRLIRVLCLRLSPFHLNALRA